MSAIVLTSKPGLQSVSALSIPKDWDQTWMKNFVSNVLKGGDVRNAVGANGIVVSGNLASPYATIALGGTGPIVLTNDVTINPPSGTPLTVKINGTTLFIVNGTTAPTIQGYGPNAGGLVDMTPDSGTFTATLTGCTTSPTATARWSRNGNQVTLTIPQLTGTSNANTCTITGLPAEIQATSAGCLIALPEDFVENGGALVNTVSLAVLNSGTITLYLGGSSSGWGTTLIKGFSAGSGITVTYQIN
jgi:hypothetical protein